MSRAEFSAVRNLFRMDALECEASAFILINIFMGRKPSQGRIRLITGVCSLLFLLGYCPVLTLKQPMWTLAKEKELPQPPERDPRQTRGNRHSPVLPLGFLVDNTARGHDACTQFVSCVSLHTSPSRDHSEDTYWETCSQRHHLCGGYSECLYPTSPRPQHLKVGAM